MEKDLRATRGYWTNAAKGDFRWKVAPGVEIVQGE